MEFFFIAPCSWIIGLSRVEKELRLGHVAICWAKWNLSRPLGAVPLLRKLVAHIVPADLGKYLGLVCCLNMGGNSETTQARCHRQSR